MHNRSLATAALLVSVLASGCGLVVTEQASGVPEGYHQMPNGMLMADVQMVTQYRDIMNNGIQLPTHQRPDGTVILGSAPVVGEHGGGHNHALPDPADFPQGVVPVGLTIPRIGLTAPVVATELTAQRIQGPPVAGDLAWLEATRRPGEIGPAIIGGVTELDGVPGAFARLTELAPGDQLIVVADDGTVLPYQVESAAWSRVADRAEVFKAGDPRSEVRLVAWSIDGATADYVVRAFAVSPEPTLFTP